MAQTWRLLDTGLGSAARNIALARAVLEARQADEIPSTLRFLRFTPAALLGCNESAAQALDVDRCLARGIAVQRRLTGGPAFYVDERQLGWELFVHRRDLGSASLNSVSRRIGHTAAAAVKALGVEASCSSANELEVDGRAIGCGAIVVDADAVLFQGFLWLESDPDILLDVLRTPATQLGDPVAEVRSRYTSLHEALGCAAAPAVIKHNLAEAFESEFDVEFGDGDLTLSEERRFDTALCEIDTQGWIDLVAALAADMPLVAATRSVAGSRLRAALLYDVARQAVRQIWFNVGANVPLRCSTGELEAALRDVPVGRLAATIESHFANQGQDLLPFTPQDFIAVVRLAIGRPLLARSP